MVWQTYDYYFEPTAAYFAIKKASEPLHIQWNPATDEVEVVNYSAGTHKGLTAKVQVLNMDASVAWEKETTVDSNEDTTDKCIKLEFPENLSKVHFIKMTLTEDGKVVSTTSITEVWKKTTTRICASWQRLLCSPQQPWIKMQTEPGVPCLLSRTRRLHRL